MRWRYAWADSTRFIRKLSSMGSTRLLSMRKDICELELKCAVPRMRPLKSITRTASPATADPRSMTSVAKIHGCPDATRSAALLFTRTVGCDGMAYLNKLRRPVAQIKKAHCLRTDKLVRIAVRYRMLSLPGHLIHD